MKEGRGGVRLPRPSRALGACGCDLVARPGGVRHERVHDDWRLRVTLRHTPPPVRASLARSGHPLPNPTLVLKKDYPDHHDAELVLERYELRRESVMRDSRRQLNAGFWPSSSDESSPSATPSGWPMRRRWGA